MFQSLNDIHHKRDMAALPYIFPFVLEYSQRMFLGNGVQYFSIHLQIVSFDFFYYRTHFHNQIEFDLYQSHLKFYLAVLSVDLSLVHPSEYCNDHIPPLTIADNIVS